MHQRNPGSRYSKKCPFCKIIHPVSAKEKSFSQNKYILNQIKRKSKEEKQQSAQLCEEHGKEPSLFCKEPGCQMPICIMCLRRHHRTHDIVEIEEMEALMKDVKIVQTNLVEKRKVLLKVLKEVEEKTKKCVTALNKKIVAIE